MDTATSQQNHSRCLTFNIRGPAPVQIPAGYGIRGLVEHFDQGTYELVLHTRRGFTQVPRDRTGPMRALIEAPLPDLSRREAACTPVMKTQA